MCHFRAQNGPFVMNKIFIITSIITFIYLLPLFIVQSLKKLLQQIQSYDDVPFLGPKWSIWKINIILIYLSAPFIAQNYKKILPLDPGLCIVGTPLIKVVVGEGGYDLRKIESLGGGGGWGQNVLLEMGDKPEKGG